MAFSDDLAAAIRPWWTQELEDYVRALATFFRQIEQYATDGEDGTEIAWATMLDVDAAPVEALPYLAQWVGERLPVGLSEADERQWIRDAPNQDRGTTRSIARVAQRWLEGSKTMFVRERSKLDLTADADWVAIITYAAETPSESQVARELRKAVPADIMIDYTTSSGSTWSTVETDYATWGAVDAAFATWGDVAGIPPSYSGFTPWYR